MITSIKRQEHPISARFAVSEQNNSLSGYLTCLHLGAGSSTLENEAGEEGQDLIYQERDFVEEMGKEVDKRLSCVQTGRCNPDIILLTVHACGNVVCPINVAFHVSAHHVGKRSSHYLVD